MTPTLVYKQAQLAALISSPKMPTKIASGIQMSFGLSIRKVYIDIIQK